MWRQSTQNNITYPPLQGNGWKVENSSLNIQWDSEENISKVRMRVALIKKGCACKIGCKTVRCKCKKNNNPCGPGCKCVGCCNMPNGVTPGQASVEQENDDVDSSESEDDMTDKVDKIMSSVFGNRTSDGEDNENIWMMTAALLMLTVTMISVVVMTIWTYTLHGN